VKYDQRSGLYLELPGVSSDNAMAWNPRAVSGDDRRRVFNETMPDSDTCEIEHLAQWAELASLLPYSVHAAGSKDKLKTYLADKKRAFELVERRLRAELYKKPAAEDAPTLEPLLLALLRLHFSFYCTPSEVWEKNESEDKEVRPPNRSWIAALRQLNNTSLKRRLLYEELFLRLVNHAAHPEAIANDRGTFAKALFEQLANDKKISERNRNRSGVLLFRGEYAKEYMNELNREDVLALAGLMQCLETPLAEAGSEKIARDVLYLYACLMPFHGVPDANEFFACGPGELTESDVIAQLDRLICFGLLSSRAKANLADLVVKPSSATPTDTEAEVELAPLLMTHNALALQLVAALSKRPALLKAACTARSYECETIDFRLGYRRAHSLELNAEEILASALEGCHQNYLLARAIRKPSEEPRNSRKLAEAELFDGLQTRELKVRALSAVFGDVAVIAASTGHEGPARELREAARKFVGRPESDQDLFHAGDAFPEPSDYLAICTRAAETLAATKSNLPNEGGNSELSAEDYYGKILENFLLGPKPPSLEDDVEGADPNDEPSPPVRTPPWQQEFVKLFCSRRVDKQKQLLADLATANLAPALHEYANLEESPRRRYLGEYLASIRTTIGGAQVGAGLPDGESLHYLAERFCDRSQMCRLQEHDEALLKSEAPLTGELLAALQWSDEWEKRFAGTELRDLLGKPDERGGYRGRGLGGDETDVDRKARSYRDAVWLAMSRHFKDRFESPLEVVRDGSDSLDPVTAPNQDSKMSVTTESTRRLCQAVIDLNDLANLHNRRNPFADAPRGESFLASLRLDEESVAWIKREVLGKDCDERLASAAAVWSAFDAGLVWREESGGPLDVDVPQALGLTPAAWSQRRLDPVSQERMLVRWLSMLQGHDDVWRLEQDVEELFKKLSPKMKSGGEVAPEFALENCSEMLKKWTDVVAISQVHKLWRKRPKNHPSLVELSGKDKILARLTTAMPGGQTVWRYTWNSHQSNDKDAWARNYGAKCRFVDLCGFVHYNSAARSNGDSESMSALQQLLELVAHTEPAVSPYEPTFANGGPHLIEARDKWDVATIEREPWRIKLLTQMCPHQREWVAGELRILPAGFAGYVDLIDAQLASGSP